MSDKNLAVVTPGILAGGSGTRVWPLSRKSYTKQFVPLLREQTLFRSVVARLSGEGEGFAFARPVVLTNATFRFIVAEQLAPEDTDPRAIIIEPSVRNTDRKSDVSDQSVWDRVDVGGRGIIQKKEMV